MPRARSKSSSVTGGSKGRKAARSLKGNTATVKQMWAVATPGIPRSRKTNPRRKMK